MVLKCSLKSLSPSSSPSACPTCARGQVSVNSESTKRCRCGEVKCCLKNNFIINQAKDKGKIFQQ